MDERNGKAGRDASGKFTRGNKGGPGRPPRAVEESYVKQLAARVTPERWTAIVDKAIQQAEAGDAKARAWLSTCLVGNQPLSDQQLIDAYRDVEMKLDEQNDLKRQLLAQGQNAPAERPPWMPADGSDPLDKWCEPDIEGAPVPPGPGLGDTLIDVPPPHRYPGDDEVERILNG